MGPRPHELGVANHAIHCKNYTECMQRVCMCSVAESRGIHPMGEMKQKPEIFIIANLEGKIIYLHFRGKKTFLGILGGRKF